MPQRWGWCASFTKKIFKRILNVVAATHSQIKHYYSLNILLNNEVTEAFVNLHLIIHKTSI